jgi:hypothetical protein
MRAKLRWAIAGRDEAKLQAVRAGLKRRRNVGLIVAADAMVPGMQQHPLLPLADHPGRNAGPGGGQVGGTLQSLDGEQVVFAGLLQGLPGPGLGGGMHEATHQQVLAPVRRPEQFQAGHGGALADGIPHRHQLFRRLEVIRLMGDGQAPAIQSLLHRSQGQAPPVDAQCREKFRQGDAIFHRHRIAAVQDHRQASGGEVEGHQGQ